MSDRQVTKAGTVTLPHDLRTLPPNARDVLVSRRLPGGSPRPMAARGAVARIYRPARNAMQSGRANTRHWVLEFEPMAPTRVEPLMGWTASRDPLQQVRLTFPDRESAVAFARRQGWRFSADTPPPERRRPKSYADALKPAV